MVILASGVRWCAIILLICSLCSGDDDEDGKTKLKAWNGDEACYTQMPRNRSRDMYWHGTHCLGQPVEFESMFTKAIVTCALPDCDRSKAEARLEALHSTLVYDVQCWPVLSDLLCRVYQAQYHKQQRKVFLADRDACLRARQACRAIVELDLWPPELGNASCHTEPHDNLYADGCSPMTHQYPRPMYRWNAYHKYGLHCLSPLVRVPVDHVYKQLADRVFWLPDCAEPCHSPFHSQSARTTAVLFVLIVACVVLLISAYILFGGFLARTHPVVTPALSGAPLKWRAALDRKRCLFRERTVSESSTSCAVQHHHRRWPLYVVFVCHLVLSAVVLCTTAAPSLRHIVQCEPAGILRRREPTDCSSGTSLSLCALQALTLLFCLWASFSAWFYQLLTTYYPKLRLSIIVIPEKSLPHRMESLLFSAFCLLCPLAACAALVWGRLIESDGVFGLCFVSVSVAAYEHCMPLLLLHAPMGLMLVVAWCTTMRSLRKSLHQCPSDQQQGGATMSDVSQLILLCAVSATVLLSCLLVLVQNQFAQLIQRQFELYIKCNLKPDGPRDCVLVQDGILLRCMHVCVCCIPIAVLALVMLNRSSHGFYGLCCNVLHCHWPQLGSNRSSSSQSSNNECEMKYTNHVSSGGRQNAPLLTQPPPPVVQQQSAADRALNRVRFNDDVLSGAAGDYSPAAARRNTNPSLQFDCEGDNNTPHTNKCVLVNGPAQQTVRVKVHQLAPGQSDRPDAADDSDHLIDAADENDGPAASSTPLSAGSIAQLYELYEQCGKDVVVSTHF